MREGMMWFDNSKTALPEKVEIAAEYYLKKYQRAANMCVVNPGDLGREQARTGGMLVQAGNVRVESLRAILPGHLWIGVDA